MISGMVQEINPKTFLATDEISVSSKYIDGYTSTDTISFRRDF